MLLDPFIDYLDVGLDLGSWVQRQNGIVIDNFIFFLHYRISVGLFFVASLLVTTGLYIADPIECISDLSVIEVIDSYCWVHSTFTIPANWNSSTLTPHPGVTTQNSESSPYFHNYYQWGCYILAFQAMVFYLPHGLWRTLEGGNVQLLLSHVQKSLANNGSVTEDKEERFYTNKIIADSRTESKLIQYFTEKRGKHDWYFQKLLFCETLNFIIVLGQMYCATFTNFNFYDAIHYLSTNDLLEREDQIAKIFPKVTKCVFNTYGPSGNIIGNDALCVLPFNVINEKIYLGMWLWLLIVGCLSVILLIHRLLLLLIPAFRIMILKHSTKYTDIPSFRVLHERLSVGDWMLLRNLSKNLDLLQFTDIVKSLQRQFEDDIEF